MRGQTRHQQLSFGEGFIDSSLYELDDELKRVDALLSQKELLEPFEEVFSETMGRPGTPIPVYLRMQFLKYRYGLSYEEVECEVTERIRWRFFCHLTLQDKVPDSTTLIKLNQRFGDERLAKLNKALVKHLVKTKAIRPRKIRIDSTTIETHITYPTDIGLLHQVVKTLTRHAKDAGAKISNHVRATKKALAQLGASLKSKNKKQKSQLKETLRRTMTLATETVEQCKTVINRASEETPAHKDFERDLRIAEEILEQTEQKLNGVSSIPERIVSLYDPEARPIRKGKLKKPNEFGRTLQLVQDSSGVILDHELQHGNPSDKTELLPLVKKFKKQFRRAPSDIATDKGYYSQENIRSLRSLKVKRTAIPKIGRLSKKEKRRQHSKWFKTLQRFRCGIEAGISMLKRCFSLGDVHVRGTKATAVCVNWAIFSYNIWQMT
jgi:IS5 family transposase